ncbi:MAG: cob(I)yrinic acid a,c-diamide adenosyltransferase [Deltaproteobacteria bacterium]|nr:cob(I)yrinic acid a,c-diamide adenosyltransferase [Deltaproteobacteria bacterium]
MKGQIIVLTGDGKGKTTSALGMALKAAGSGQRVYIAQFIKAGDYSEIKALKKPSDFITVEQFGLGGFFGRNPTLEDIQAARNGLEKVAAVMSSGDYPVIILDEANVAIKYKLFSEQELLDIIAIKSDNLAVIITGRDAAPKIIESADQAIEFKAVKHYYKNGVKARVGIDK